MKTGDADDFGSVLRRYRRAAGLTQEALAERATLSVRGIQDLERGVSQTPRSATIHLLAQALHLSAEDRAVLVIAGDGESMVSAPNRRTSSATPSGLIPLVGRVAELSVLDRFVAGGPDSAPLLLLAGEPGLGKTRLLQVAAQRAVGQGWTVLAGGCYRSGGQEPYSPVLDALSQFLHAQPPARLATLTTGCGWLVHLLPELAGVLEPLPSVTLAPGQERRLLFAAISRLLVNAAGPAGTLVVLDDLQWAGADALDLLATLIRTPDHAVRILGSYRDTDVRPTDPLSVLLGDLAPAGMVQQQELGPLNEADASALLANLLVGAKTDGTVAERVLQRAGGTPFFLVSYAQSLSLGGGDVVPWDLAQGVRQRMALLPPASAEILAAVAIAGRRVNWHLLQEVVGLPEDEMLAGLEETLRARLLLEDGIGGYSFAHDVIREVVEAGIATARRAAIHRRVARAMEGGAEPVPVELLAYHYARSDVRAKALDYLERAGDEAWAQHAPASAEAHYRELLGLVSPHAPVADARRVREKLANVLYASGRYDAAVPILEEVADELAALEDWPYLARVTARLGWAHSRRGTADDGIARIESLLETLNQRGEPSPVALHAALGQLLFGAGEYRASLLATEQAAEHARGSGDDMAALLVDVQLMNILQTVGRINDALQVSESLFPRIAETDDLDALRRAYGDLACIHAFRGELAAARRYIAPAFEAAERTGDPALMTFPLSIGAWVDMIAGDWASARTNLRRALGLNRDGLRSWYSPYPLVFLGRLDLLEGNWDGAHAASMQAVALAQQTGDLQAVRWASLAAVEIQLREGRAQEALVQARPLLDRHGLEECDVSTLLPLLALAHLQMDQVAEARRWIERALLRARREGMRPLLVETLRVAMMIAHREERWRDAERMLNEGLTLAQAIGFPFGEARLLRASAPGGKAVGDGIVAEQRLHQALAIFRRLGAAGDAAEVEDALRALRAPG